MKSVGVTYRMSGNSIVDVHVHVWPGYVIKPYISN